MKSSYRMTLAKIELAGAEPRAKELLDKALKQNGMIPNMYAYMANAPGVLETYTHGSALFRKDSGFTPAEQEVVFLTISYENGCEYCVAAHSLLADTKSGVSRVVTEAIRNGTEIPDARLRALSEFSRAVVLKRGRLADEDVRPFLAAGYSEAQILQVILAVAVKTISNYTNHLFETPVDAVFAARTWKKAI